MSVADKLSYLNETKEAIRQAIIDKGVEVLETDAFRAYADKIGDISGGGEWSWPADWPDITSIVENDTDNEFPYKCIWLLRNDSPTFDYTKGTGVEKVLLSDGTVYTDSFTDHTWGTNTDVTITNYRWIIIYMSSKIFLNDYRPISITYNSVFLNWETSFSHMFNNCYSLQTIPQLDTSSVTNFSNMFGNCYSLQTIPQLDTSNGTNFDYMFNNCSSLQTIPQLDTSNGTNFDYMFNNCSSLQTIPQLDTSNGTNFDYMFSVCRSIQTIPQLDTSSGTNFNNMFSYCSSLQAIPQLDTSSGTNFNNMFRNCSTLQYIDATSPTSHNYNISVSFNGSRLLSKTSIINIFNNLPTKTGQTIIITSATNAKLTTEEKEIATNKGWTISVSG